MSEQQTQSLGILQRPYTPGEAGRPPIPIDLDAVRQLAKELVPIASMHAMLGISRASFTVIRKQHPEVVDAIEQGRAEHQRQLARQLTEAAERPLGTAERIFLAKQPEEKGGLGFVDRIDHRHEGTVNHVMMPALDQWQKAKQLAQETDIIEGDYEEVD
jgi:hypothetical protein